VKGVDVGLAADLRRCRDRAKTWLRMRGRLALASAATPVGALSGS
jgi:hypothetical protein